MFLMCDLRLAVPLPINSGMPIAFVEFARRVNRLALNSTAGMGPCDHHGGVSRGTQRPLFFGSKLPTGSG